MNILSLVAALIIILAGAEAFTNALEHLGDRLGISEGVTGSIFAAVGTALPETMVPIVAVFAVTSGQPAHLGEEVGVGAILGAPMMLSTLTLFVMALFVSPQRGWRGALNPEPTGLRRDLGWFLVAFGLSAIALFVPHHITLVRIGIGLVLVTLYFLYVMVTLRASAALVADGHGTEAGHALYLGRIGLPTQMPAILIQLAIGLGMIVFGASLFVDGIEGLSHWLGISALILSLLLVPVATELPEKINSILWIRRRKDTLAFANITGALVFQGSLLPAIGVLLTPWSPSPPVLLGAGLTLLAGGYTYLLVRRGVTLRPYHFLFNGACYGAYFFALT
ncbi:sodium/calcium exchanger membrane region [Acidithiobacillus ferrivorans SS3]|jgi:cation:H+ antiporter|uniref:Sodium/calcium exchanger membrane region n=2 Tax=Acidithiobacillus ferrivorans TaxID=160808 RepID=G0JN39_9PROT|nr:sodium:calcium antiporter [Acidithiobacillus ferrivorans]AEM47144.1 sodium/calcium exchanger membrane region [Acidithiobacillus ferrivorans SS3]OFA15336.1 sodium:proton exchanger [Acidithiobacillus ferrivorans]